jgi:outer membrane protein TolC
MIEVLPLNDAVQEAIEKRPDVQQNRLRLCAHDINIRAVRNALLPTTTLTGTVTSTGLAGNTRTGTVVSGFGDAASTALSGDFPIYEASLTFNLPFRNRAAQADYARALLLERQEQASLQQLQNTVAVDVQNTQIALRQSRAAVSAAQKTRELQEQALSAEQTRFQLGASTIFLVVQAQRDLSTAASAEVRALTNLVKARVDLERAMGRTLEANQIDVVEELGIVRCHTELTGNGLNGTLIGQGQR